jgi:hypothetical protein
VADGTSLRTASTSTVDHQDELRNCQHELRDCQHESQDHQDERCGSQHECQDHQDEPRDRQYERCGSQDEPIRASVDLTNLALRPCPADLVIHVLWTSSSRDLVVILLWT